MAALPGRHFYARINGLDLIGVKTIGPPVGNRRIVIQQA